GIRGRIGGEVQIGFSDAVIALPFVGSDKIRMLAVSTTERLASAPELPTIAESGVAGFQSSTDVALFAPAGTPEPIIRRLYEALAAALKSPAVKGPIEAQGASAVGGSRDRVATDLLQE